MSVILGFLSY